MSVRTFRFFLCYFHSINNSANVGTHGSCVRLQHIFVVSFHHYFCCEIRGVENVDCRGEGKGFSGFENSDGRT